MSMYRVRFAQASLEAEEFLQFILRWDPRQRPSADDCLQHSYLADFHQEDEDGQSIDEPTRPQPLQISMFHFDYKPCGKEVLLDEYLN